MSSVNISRSTSLNKHGNLEVSSKYDMPFESCVLPQAIKLQNVSESYEI